MPADETSHRSFVVGTVIDLRYSPHDPAETDVGRRRQGAKHLTIGAAILAVAAMLWL